MWRLGEGTFASLNVGRNANLEERFYHGPMASQDVENCRGVCFQVPASKPCIAGLVYDAFSKHGKAVLADMAARQHLVNLKER